MRRLGHVALAAGLVLAAGCGGAPKKDAAPPPKLDVPKLPAGSAHTRDVSEGIRRHWPFDDRLKGALYADVDAMMKMDLFRALAQVSEEKCVGEVLGKMREVAIGVDDRGALAVARFADPLPKAALETCSGQFADGKRTLVIAPPLAFFGDRALVEAASAGGSGQWPSSLTISQDQVVSWTAHADEVNARGGVRASNERFRVDGTAEVPEELGELVERQLAKGAMLGPLAKALKVDRRGRRLEIVFELREPPIDQARDIGMLAAIATHGIRSYLTRSKGAEAKSTVAAIARTYVADWDRDDGKPRAKRKLLSYPPVPKTVPKGTTHPSTPQDWAAWKTLHFEMSLPQRFQYEIIAAKDGESARIVARGDLNGDGKTSLFEVMVKVDRAKDVLVVAPTISETDPDE